MPGLLGNAFLDINGISKHLGVAEGLPSDYQYNERNPGFGVTFESPARHWIKSISTGYYDNSFNKPSYYLGGSLAKRFGNDYYADLGIFGGLATGYKGVKGYHKGKEYEFPEYRYAVQPMGGLMANLGKKDVGRIGIKYAPSKPSLLMMNLGIPFK